MFTFISTLAKLNSYSFLFLLVAFIYANLLFLLARRRSMLATFLFILVLIAMLGNVFTTFLALNAGNDTVFRTANQWMIFTNILSAPLFVTFIFAYTKREKFLQTVQYVLFIFMPAIVMLFFAWNTNLLVDYSLAHAAHTILGNWVLQTRLGAVLFPLYQLLYAIIGIMAFFSYQERLTDPASKRHTAMMVLGYYIPAFTGLFLANILSSLLHVTLIPIGDLFIALGMIFVAYSLLRYTSVSFDPMTYATKIFETINEAVIVVNAAYSIEFINKAGETMFQHSGHMLQNQPLSRLFSSPATYSEVLNTVLIPLQKTDSSHLEEITLAQPDTKQLPVAISAAKFQDDDQQVTGYILTFSDLSRTKIYQMNLEERNREVQKDTTNVNDLQQQLLKQKQIIEEKVSEQTKNAAYEQQRLFSAINDLSVGFIMTNANKNIILLNKAIKDIFSLIYPEGNIALQDVQNHLRGVNLTQQIDLAMQGKRQIRLKNIQADNTLLNIFVTPITMAGLTQAEVVGAVILIETSMEPESVQHAKEEFFTIASHELRTPLSAIRGYLSLIKQLYFDKLPDQQLKQMLTDIDISSTRLLAIINDFLDTSKLEQGRMDVKKEPCDIVSITQAAIKETQSIAIQKQLYLKLQSPPSPLTVLGDKDRLKQIIINLISNAMRSTMQGGITVTLEPTNDQFVKVLVSDTGKGIAHEGQRLLFQKFQQVSQSSYAKETGTGLGLYISKLLIEKMDGKIQLETSDIDKGSTFSFTIPVFHP